MPSLTRLSRNNTSELEQTGMKRRKSSVTSLKSLPLAFRSKRKDSDAPATHIEEARVNWSSLPTELQIQVFNHLSFVDLCALRATCRASNHSITGPDSAVARYWVSSKLNSVHRLYPAPSSNHWGYLATQMHRWHIARHLAEMIAYHIQYKTLLYVQRHSSSNVLSASILAALLLPQVYSGQKNQHSAQKHMRFQPVAYRIRRKMTPLLFILSHYLSSCQADLQSSQIALTLSGESTTFWTGMESPERYTSYTRDQLFGAHYCWLFLEWIFNTILSKPSYAGTLERTVRGWTSTPLDRSSLVQVLVHGNLTAVKQLFRLKDYGERKKWAMSFLKKLNPELNSISWASSWEALDLRHADVPSKAQATAILRGPGKMDSLWTRGAARRLLALGIELEDNELHGNVATTMRFLTDVAGFDLFHEEPPGDMLADDESDSELANDAGDDDDQSPPTPEEEQMAIVQGLEEETTNYWDV